MLPPWRTATRRGGAVGPDAVAVVLRRASPFRVLSADRLTAVATVVVPRHLRPRQVLFADGDPGEAAYVLAEGTIKLACTSRDGEELVIRAVQPPELFGELSLLDRAPRSTWAESVGSSTVLAVTAATWKDLLADAAFVDALLAYLASRLRGTTQQLVEQALLDLTGRVAAVLLRLADLHGSPEGEGVRMELPLTQSELAAMVGGSRQSVNQALRSLERRGDLAVDGRVVVLLDPAALRRRAAI